MVDTDSMHSEVNVLWC